MDQRWQAAQLRDDRRSALIAYLLAEIHRDRQQRSRSFTLEEFLLHRWDVPESVAERPAQTAEQQRDMLMAFVQAMGGVPEGNGEGG